MLWSLFVRAAGPYPNQYNFLSIHTATAAVAALTTSCLDQHKCSLTGLQSPVSMLSADMHLPKAQLRLAKRPPWPALPTLAFQTLQEVASTLFSSLISTGFHLYFFQSCLSIPKHGLSCYSGSLGNKE